jgi:hypothetical protein
VTLHQAAQYCAWVDRGHVATLEEWMKAARGPDVRRFAWGDDRRDCTHRWRLVFNPELPSACCDRDCAAPEARAVGLHPAGESPFGVADVLSAHAELVAQSPSSETAACTGEGGCFVAGLEPGAIDWVHPAPVFRPEGEPEAVAYAAAFRCAWKGEVAQ